MDEDELYAGIAARLLELAHRRRARLAAEAKAEAQAKESEQTDE